MPDLVINTGGWFIESIRTASSSLKKEDGAVFGLICLICLIGLIRLI